MNNALILITTIALLSAVSSVSPPLSTDSPPPPLSSLPPSPPPPPLSPLSPVNMTKPLMDERDYTTVTLSNNLEVLLIHDPSITQAQVSLGVEVGSLQDPPTFQGLAHFLEHMLFMGSTKYPSTTAFSACIARHQGTSNAYTSQRHTLYFFNLVMTGLIECLDIFAQFFVSPLFLDTAVFKEVNAVHSEYSNYLSNHNWADFYASQLLVSPNHPYHNFNVGNLDSLLYEPQTQHLSLIHSLHTFHNTYYSSNIMKLVIISNINTDTLLNQVTQMFTPINNTHQTPQYYFNQTMNIYGHEQLLVKYAAKKQIKQLSMYFEINLPENEYSKQSLQVALKLMKVTDYSPDSLSRYLKENNYIYSFDYGQDIVFNQKTIVRFVFDLTHKGYANVKHILRMFFQKVKQIDKALLDDQVFNNLKLNSQAQFMYSNKISQAYKLVEKMFSYELTDSLYGDYKYTSFDKEQVVSILNTFKKENAQYVLANDQFIYDKDSQTEQKIKSKKLNMKHHYKQIEYQIVKSIMNFRNLKTQKTHPNPTANKYLPNSLTKIPQNTIIECQQQLKQNDLPLKIIDDEYLSLWHKRVIDFELPQQMLSIKINSPISFRSPTASAANKLLGMQLSHMVEDKLYEVAELSNIYSIQINTDIEGVQLKFIGHQEKLNNLVLDFFKLVNEYTLKEEAFIMIKEQLKNNLFNFQKENAVFKLKSEFYQLMLKSFYLESELFTALDNLSFYEYNQYYKDFFKDFIIEAYSTGNIDQQESTELAKEIITMFKMTKSGTEIKQSLLKQSVKNLFEQKLSLTTKNSNTNDNNHSIIDFIQIGIDNIYYNTILQMISKKLKNDAFEYLRSDKQLGYIVGGSLIRIENTLGFMVMIQGTVKDVESYHKEVKTFWKLTDKYFGNMKLKDFNEMKSAYKQKLKEKDQSLEENNAYYWQQIIQKTYNFDIKNQALAVLDGLNMENVVDFYQNQFKNGHLTVKQKTAKEYEQKDEEPYKKFRELINNLPNFTRVN